MKYLAPLTAVGVFFAAMLLTRRFANPTSALHILDHPNERSLHQRPIPRSGGVAILIALLVGMVVLFIAEPPHSMVYCGALSALAIAAISFADDRAGVSALFRFIVHIGAATAAVWCGANIDPALNSNVAQVGVIGVSIIYLVWMTNLYNFMDGMDGFAAGMAVVGFGSFALLGLLGGDHFFAALAGLVVAAAAGFLTQNFPPARIFMGDTGSALLGFLAGSFSLWGAQRGVFSFWTALLVFSPFIADATVTLARRIFHGEKIWQPHKTHYYQRLVQLGWGHKKTVLAEYVLMMACAASAIGAILVGGDAPLFLLGVWIIIYVMLAVVVSRKESLAAK